MTEIVELTREQSQAVHTDSREVVVIAGAGSGKTRVLIYRALELMNRGALPEEIMLVTFTRAAAEEMRRRLQESVSLSADPDDAHDVYRASAMLADMRIGTFHAIAWDIVKQHAEKLGYDARQLTICSPDDSEATLLVVAQSLGYLRDRNTWTAGLSHRNLQSYLEGLYSGRVHAIEDSPPQRIVDEYWSRLHQMNAIDYGSILRELKNLFDRYPATLESYQQQIRHVLVDELQDTDFAQHELLRYFTANATFFGVGDFRQSIYGWRGARPDLMLSQYGQGEIVDLTQNFRSGSKVVEVANALIAHNSGQQAKPMASARNARGRYVNLMGRSEQIADMLEILHRDGYAWREIALLARKHHTLRRVVRRFGERGLPFHRVCGPVELSGLRGMQGVRSVLRLAANPRDDLAAGILLANSGLTNVQRGRIYKQAAQRDCPLLDAFGDVCGAEFQGEPVVGPFHWLRQIWQSHGGELIDDALTVLRSTILQGEDVSAQSRIYPYIRHKTCADACAALSMLDSQSDLPGRDQDVVTLLTVHAAKGLEWPCVIVANCNEGEFPSAQAMRDEDGIEEERRLFYVAITRAADTIVLHHRRPEDQRTRTNGRSPAEPSRFLRELGT